MTIPTPGDGIRLVGLTKRYVAGAPPAVDAIDLAVPRGTLTTILGPSGCGKTTTLRMIAGLETPSAGRVVIDGRDVTALGAAERGVGMVFQSYALFPHLNVVDNVAYGLRVSGTPADAARRRARDAMAAVGLEGLDARSPSEISGGQQQRVALARSLVLEPSVLLFDEPLSNLDARLRRAMRDEIRALQRRLGLTVAYVTHDQGEALAVSDQVVVMDRGRIAQAGPPRELHDAPASRFVAGFIGEAMLLPAVVAADGRRAALGPLTVALPRPAVPGPATLAVRPHAWRIADAAPAAATGGTLPATLVKRAYLGDHQELTLATALGEIFAIEPDTSREWPDGAALALALDGRGVAVVAD